MTVSAAVLKVLTDEMSAELKPVCCAGHSLGEYTALAACGVLAFRDAVQLVHKRGIFMQEAVPEGEGAMAALLGLDEDGVKNLCDNVAPNGEIQPANFNSPGQVVISGLSEFIDKAIESAKSYGAKRAVKLNVSAPFHSVYMKPAAERLKSEFEKISWNDAKFDIIANVSAKPVKTPDEIKSSLYAQTFSPVLWSQSVSYMADTLEIKNFFEIGNGDVLSGLIKRCKKGLNLFSGATPAKVEAIREAMEASEC